MNQKTVLSSSVAVALLASGWILSAQQPTQQAPIGGPVMSGPIKAFGGNVTPAYEGWFDSADGSHNFLIGYYNRNSQEEIDIPIGPNNRFEPGGPDLGQPTHFLTRRRYGYFIVNVPKSFTKTQKVTWSLTVNGVTSTVPFQLHTDYNISPMKASEESPNRGFNQPPTLRFVEAGSGTQGPMGTGLKPMAERKATVGQPMPLDIFADDDGLYANANGSSVSAEAAIVRLEVSKYRGPGTVTVKEEPKLAAIKGGKPMEPYSGKGSTTVTFSAPGEYMLHVHALDYSGKGGGGTGCCWATAVVKVAVSGGAGTTGN